MVVVLVVVVAAGLRVRIKIRTKEMLRDDSVLVGCAVPFHC